MEQRRTITLLERAAPRDLLGASGLLLLAAPDGLRPGSAGLDASASCMRWYSQHRSSPRHNRARTAGTHSRHPACGQCAPCGRTRCPADLRRPPAGVCLRQKQWRRQARQRGRALRARSGDTTGEPRPKAAGFPGGFPAPPSLPLLARPGPRCAGQDTRWHRQAASRGGATLVRATDAAGSTSAGELRPLRRGSDPRIPALRHRPGRAEEAGCGHA